MLQLSIEQLELVSRLQTRRQAQGVAQVLAQAWPEVAQRLEARWPDFVAAALERAHALGLSAPADLARYTSLCCLWGAGFESKPGFEWAGAIVADARRAPTLQLHQLLYGSREALAQTVSGPGANPGGLTPSALDHALAAIDAGMAQQQGVRTVFLDLPEAPRLQACDLDALSLALVEPHPLQTYQLADGAWRRINLPRLTPEPQQWTQADGLPNRLPVVSRPAGAGAGARLNLAVQTRAMCGHGKTSKHPEVAYRSAQGLLHWRGADTAKLSLALHAPTAEPEEPQAGPLGIAHAVPPDPQTLRIASCGVRHAGAPFGDLELALPVYPAAQHLLEVGHTALPRINLPMPPAAHATPAQVKCVLEIDGVSCETRAWTGAWLGLQTQTRAGLEKLFNAWARAMAPTSTPQLEGVLSPLVGQAGITWGWQRSSADAVDLRVEGLLQWVPLVADLSLSGDLAWEGATAHLELRVQGRHEWALQLRQIGATAAEGQGLADARTTWRLPLTLSMVALASGEPAMLSAAPLPEALQGALVGECGLRPRPDGQGWQWYYRLAVEAVQVALVCSDPLLGEQRSQRELLPAMTLVDWSAG